MKSSPILPVLFGALSLAVLWPARSLAQVPVWKALGPSPIVDSAAEDSIKNEESGKILAIAVHPTNPKIVYVGTGNGGLYRSNDGGNQWTLIDLSAPPGPTGQTGQTASIGALAISASDPTTLFVGTGDARGGVDNFFGLGVYVVRTADTAPAVTGPFAMGAENTDVFTGTSITQIAVDPTDAQTIFVATALGKGGIGLIGTNDANDPGPDKRGFLGVYRTTMALGAAPKFTRITGATDVSVRDLVIEPGNAKVLLYATRGADGGVFRTEDALAPQPVFEKTLALPSTQPRLAINKVGDVVTVLVATSEKAPKNLGKVRRSTDGGKTWETGEIAAANEFAGTQANINVAIDPTNAKVFYVGGATKPGKVMVGTIDGGDSFNQVGGPATKGLHPDTQVIRVAPSDPSIVYLGCDGGIWKTTRGGQDWKTVDPLWENLNNMTFSATQFVSLAQHPRVRDYLVGGTQDNGTDFLRSNGVWFELVGGDGGVALIDQNAVDRSDVTIYHTFSNDVKNIKFDRVKMNGDVEADRKTIGGPEGISQDDSAVLFYNPMALGPGNPNTLYFGTDRIYRSVNRGDTMTVVAGPFVDKISVSAIGISAQDDNVRIAGLENGKVFTTSSGSAMTEVTPQTGGKPVANYVSRTIIDPLVKTTAYVTYAGYGLADGETIWKTTNLDATTPTWTAVGKGVPGPVNAFCVDPRSSAFLYAGTDTGVYASTDGGATWAVYGTGLPRLTVWDLGVQKLFGVLRIATHGRGMWEVAATAPPDQPAIVAKPATVTEGVTPAPLAGGAPPPPTTLANFVINLSGPSSHLITFHYTTVDGTAKAGSDYIAQSGTVTFMPGETQKTIAVQIIDDSDPEPTESFSIALSDPVGGSLADDDVIGTIMSNEAAAVLSIAPVSVVEGNAGTTSAVFNVTLSPASNQTVTVDYTTADVTASAGNDYQPINGTVIFAPGDTMKPITVQVRGDTLPEENETFRVTLSNPTGEAQLSVSAALGTISNDDGAAPATTTANATLNMVNASGAAAIYPSTIAVSGLNGTVSKVTVRLLGVTHSYPSDLDVLLVGPQGQKVMLMSDAGGSEPVAGLNFVFDDSAAAKLDVDNIPVSGAYQPTDFEPGDVLAAPAPAGPFGTQLAVFNGTVPNGDWHLFVFDDTTGDGGEIGSWSLSISTQTAPAVPYLTIADVKVMEGNAGTTAAVFTARLSAASASPVTVAFATADGTAAAGQDYTAASGTLTFAPGQTAQTIVVSVLGSTDVEPDQTFFVNLTNPAGATLADNQAMGTIVNDDVIPEISINDLGEEKSVKDGPDDGGQAIFTVSLSQRSSQEVRVDFTTQNETALAGQDYEATAGTLVFAPGETVKTITVTIIVDEIDEPEKAFLVKLSNAVAGVIVKDAGEALITGGDGLEIKEQPQDLRLQAGQTAYFVVDAEGGDMLTYQWKFNGAIIPGATEPLLTLAKVTLANAGFYTVVVSNGMDTIVSAPAELAVEARVATKALAGDYQGLIGDTEYKHRTSGAIRLHVTNIGAFSGMLSLGGTNYNLLGRFDAEGNAVVVVGRGASRLTIHLTLDQSGGGGVSGTVSNGDFTSEIFADATGAVPPVKGAFTLLLPRNPLHPELTVPQGNGHGVVTIDKLGNLRFLGRLGDGALVSQGTRVSASGYWGVYFAPYGGSGSATGWVQFREVPGKSDLDGSLDWSRPERYQKLYPAGFNTSVEVEGSAYVKTAPALSLAPSGFGDVTLADGNLLAALHEVIKIDASNKVIVTLNNDQFSLTLAPATGAFTGKFTTPTGQKRTVSGVILQKRRFAAGVFTGVDQAGSIEITPQ